MAVITGFYANLTMAKDTSYYHASHLIAASVRGVSVHASSVAFL